MASVSKPLLPAYGPTAGSYERAAAPQGGPGLAASPAAQGPHLPRVAAPLSWLNASSTLPAVRAYATSRYTARCTCGAVLQLVVSGHNLHPFDATRQLLLANAVDALVNFAPRSLDMTCTEVRLAAIFPKSRLSLELCYNHHCGFLILALPHTQLTISSLRPFYSSQF